MGINWGYSFYASIKGRSPSPLFMEIETTILYSMHACMHFWGTFEAGKIKYWQDTLGGSKSSLMGKSQRTQRGLFHVNLQMIRLQKRLLLWMALNFLFPLPTRHPQGGRTDKQRKKSRDTAFLFTSKRTLSLAAPLVADLSKMLFAGKLAGKERQSHQLPQWSTAVGEKERKKEANSAAVNSFGERERSRNSSHVSETGVLE